MMKPLIALSFALLTLASAKSAESLYYWDNNLGLKKADHCELTTMKDSRFGFINTDGVMSSYIKNNEGKHIMNIVSGSLVKQLEGSAVADHSFYEVVGTNKNSIFLMTLKQAPKSATFAERLDQGYIKTTEVESIANKTIQIEKDRLNIAAGTLLKVHGSGEFLKLACPEFDKSRDYLVFHSYVKGDASASSLVGVHFDETGLFRSIKTLEHLETQKINKAIGAEADQVADLIRDLSGKTVVFKMPEVTKPNSSDVKDILPETVTKKDEITLQDGLDNVVCMQSANAGASVRNAELTKVIFKSPTGTRVKLFQEFEDTKKERVIDGKPYTFVKAEFDSESRDKKIGYIAKAYIVPRSQCLFAKIEEKEIDPAVDTQITGLDDSKCCEFPVANKVTSSFTVSQQAFGAGRGGSRVHAATDLYRMLNEPVVAVAPGVIIRPLYFFYLGTYAVEVRHSGGFVVRYGELTGNIPKSLKGSNKVKMGQILGYIARVGTKTLMEPMLHFELYSGAASGSLNSSKKINGINYQRRSDLLNPTKYMLKWSNAKFKK
jgi:murein DD-endopeptidase MepM/ murein hydrolase activator NlpD